MLTLVHIQEEDVEKFDPTEYFDTPKEFLTRAYNRPTRETLKQKTLIENAEQVSKKDLERLEKEKDRAYSELVARMSREQKIDAELTVRSFIGYLLLHQ
jgi:ABC-type methionine transport system ATPase subunit